MNNNPNESTNPNSTNPSADDAVLEEVRTMMNNPETNETIALAMLAATGFRAGDHPVGLQMNGNTLEIHAVPTTENVVMANSRYVEVTTFGRSGYTDFKAIINTIDAGLIHFLEAFEENYRPKVDADETSVLYFLELSQRHPRPRPGHRHLRRLRTNFLKFNREYEFNLALKEHIQRAPFRGVPEANVIIMKTLVVQLTNRDLEEYENWFDILTGGNRPFPRENHA